MSVPFLAFLETPLKKEVEIISRPETDILHFCPKFHALQSSFMSFKGFDSSCNISLQLRQKATGEFLGETFFILPCFFFAHWLTLRSCTTSTANHRLSDSTCSRAETPICVTIDPFDGLSLLRLRLVQFDLKT